MLRRETRTLRDIARAIDEHAQLGCPYDLTFYNCESGNKEEITNTQREELTAYLKYHFQIWANTWLHNESDRIRDLIGDSIQWSDTKPTIGRIAQNCKP